MKFAVLLLLMLCFYLAGKLIILKSQLGKMNKQLDILCGQDTRAEVRLEKLDRSTEQLAVRINHLLTKYHHAEQQMKQNDLVFRDTITSLSHDLRTPLATANGYLQLLLEQELSADQREYTEIAGERIEAVKRLLDQLFEFARIEANELTLHRENMDLNSALRDVIAVYYHDFEKKAAQLSLEIPNQPAVIWADKGAISRILANVINNALVHGDGEYRIRSSSDSNGCTIVISNRSASIDKEDMAHLFDRFYTTDQSRSRKTTGLGLAIAKKLTLQMDGEIEAFLREEIIEIRIFLPCIHTP